MRRLRLDADLGFLAALAALVLLRFLPDWLRGLSPYWGDLAYLHQPWRAFDAELLAGGRLPLWNPFLYFGMPQAAAMQDGLFYAGSTPFPLFPFAVALAIYHAAHYWLAGALAYLALRRLRLRRAASFGGACLYALGGLLLGREPFLNHLAVLSLTPALLLFAAEPAGLALALTLGFLAGYPPLLVGGCGAALAVSWAAAPARGRWAPSAARAWLAAASTAAALGAVLLLPAAELTLRSRRAGGVDAADLMRLAFAPRDLWLWLSPRMTPGFDPAVDWWRCCYLGFVGAFAAIWGALALPRRRAAVLLLAVAAVFVLTLGGSNPASAWLWARLRWLRYPGNLAVLAGLPLSALAACGLEAARRRLALVAALVLELSLLGFRAQPRAPARLWSEPGPLARALQGEPGGHRYLLSPRALESVAGRDPFDWRERLYGLTNAPLKLRAAGNFGEPLAPAANYALMDALFSAPGAAAAAAFLPWADAATLLTPQPVVAPGLSPQAPVLWARARAARAAGARLLSAEEGAALPPGVASPPVTGRPLEVLRAREDAFAVSGEGAGWLFVSEPLYPGWSLWLETSLGPGRALALPALGPFQKVSVPAGAWTARWRYVPGSFAAGLALTLAAAGLLGAYWYNRLSKTA